MWNSFSFKGRAIVIHRTGDVVPLEVRFLRNVARVISYLGEVSAIVATRPVRAILTGELLLRDNPRIAFLPRRPQPWYAVWSVCRLARIDIVDDPEDADLLFYFEDCETSPVSHPDGTINGRCTDIRKSLVAGHFEEVFGYSLAVDPLNHAGPMVVKSERNGCHDGRIEMGPLAAAAPGMVYQRLVDATDDGVSYTDYRTYVVGSRLSVVFIKRRHGAIRFSNDNDQVSLSTPTECFSETEQAQIIRFAGRMGLEFGGMDILRDRHDGGLYIVDVNKTDMGPPIAMEQLKKRPAMQRLAADFRRMVDERLGRRPTL
ncbi:hypothetical protein [Parvularcula sp. LCG005]|uniref:hypothetical protein n=1 Tax=Parvularcula sp. LCG005 TaxID=3078805 RepID=UPI002942EA68|nr:hypothetical protein [Parvularcula sp. LCG005]WOI53603.1 hypothetical protein RUI03_01080 [Parvularcula sp. LCG005]